jgi:hypothetical protein
VAAGAAVVVLAANGKKSQETEDDMILFIKNINWHELRQIDPIQRPVKELIFVVLGRDRIDQTGPFQPMERWSKVIKVFKTLQDCISSHEAAQSYQLRWLRRFKFGRWNYSKKN